jgi:PAS domain S-box-containing protein
VPDRPSVLLVDDRPENLLTLEAVLAPLELHLVRATSGEEALKALLEDDFAAVLLDVQMPGMDGFETAGFIRRRERSRLTPIIFLTAVSTDVSHVMRGYESGAVDYVLKPFDPLILRSKVSVFADLERERRGRTRSEALLLGAMGSSPNGLVIADASDVVVRANPAMCTIIGMEQADVVGRKLCSVLGLHPDDDVARALRSLQEQPGNRYEAELLIGATETPVQLVASLVPDDEPHVLVELWDLSDRVEAERARIRLASEQSARARAEALYEREHQIASTLQRGLLPGRLPDVPGVALASHFDTGGDGTEVGGDWFDAFTLPGGRVGLVVGDVSGRGIAAASRMGQLRSVARAYATEGHPPAEVIQRLNIFHQSLDADEMTTLVYAIVEPDLERVRIANAGHPPPALAVAGSPPRLLEGASPALGVVEVCEPQEIVVDLPAGATLVLYTDGLVERRAEGVEPGLARLLTALAPSSDDVAMTLDRIVHSCGTASGDDVTVLCARADPVLGRSVALTLVPDADGLAASRRMLRRWLAEQGAAEAEAASIVLAANEAWQNAIEHGQNFAPVPISVRFECDGEEIEITVRDAGGRGTPHGDPDRGRGIDLMRAHTDEADLDLGTRRGGVVVLRRRIGAPARVP